MEVGAPRPDKSNCNARLVRTLNSHPYREYCVYVDCTDDFSEESCYTPCARVLDVAFGKTLPSEPPVVNMIRDIQCTPDVNYFGGDDYSCRLEIIFR